ncbi:YiiD C-terminal domain-containing protein [Luteimonas saliphila]|uniref:YiiD C-terminal domain-containing protein n=1 Tax=Luteimonas saliphila TaxID=2804919 RepID=UPI00192DCCFC|nr:YiiD C-terminal domain-containing protein [Luteimonas saliphila]
MTELPDDALRAMEAQLLAMPPARALGLRIAGCAHDRLRLEAPLAANVNDKGSAFGGSLVSLMTLAAWSLTTMKIEQAGLRADVYVADSQVRYLTPLLADLRAEAWLDEAASWDTFLATLRSRGRARATLDSHVLLPDGGVATQARSRYAAILKPD